MKEWYHQTFSATNSTMKSLKDGTINHYDSGESLELKMFKNNVTIVKVWETPALRNLKKHSNIILFFCRHYYISVRLILLSTINTYKT